MRCDTGSTVPSAGTSAARSRIAVHLAVVFGRHVERGAHVLRQHALQRVEGGHLLALADRMATRAIDQPHHGFVQAQHRRRSDLRFVAVFMSRAMAKVELCQATDQSGLARPRRAADADNGHALQVASWAAINALTLSALAGSTAQRRGRSSNPARAAGRGGGVPIASTMVSANFTGSAVSSATITSPARRSSRATLMPSAVCGSMRSWCCCQT